MVSLEFFIYIILRAALWTWDRFSLYKKWVSLVLAQQPPVGNVLLIQEVSRSHTTTHHIRQDFSGQVIRSLQRPISDNTKHSQQTNIHVPGGIRTLNLSRRVTANLRLRPRGHWDPQRKCLPAIFPRGQRRPVRKADLTTFMCRLSWNLLASTSWNPQGMSRPVMGLLYLQQVNNHTLLEGYKQTDD